MATFVTVVAACGLYGCGRSAPSPVSVALLSKAYSETVAAGSADVSITISQDMPPNSFTEHGTGLFDFHNDSSESQVILASGGTLQTIQVGGTYYEQSNAPNAPITPLGKPWVAVPFQPNSTEGVLKASALLADPAVAITTSAALSFLQLPISTFHRIGPQDIAEVMTTEYVATISKAQLIDEANSSRAKSSIEALQTWELPVLHVWIDTSGKIRQLQVTAQGSAVSASSGNGMTGKPHPIGTEVEEIELTDFGTPVSIVAPPASEVTYSSSAPLYAGSIPSASGGPSQQQVPSTNSADDAAAEENLRNALTNAMTIYANSQNFGTVTLTQLRQADPVLNWLPEQVAPTEPGQIGWTVVGRQYSSHIGLAAKSADGVCFYIFQPSGGPTQYGASNSPCGVPENEYLTPQAGSFPTP